MNSSGLIDILQSLWRLLTPRQRRGAFFLAVLMLVGMGFETLSTGLVIPLMALLSRADLAANYPAVPHFFAALGAADPNHWVIIGLSGFLFVYVLKTAFLGFLAYWQTRFIYGVQIALSQRLFELYLRQPYTFHLQRNSAQLIRNVTLEVSSVSEAMYFGTQLLTELFVLVALSSLLFLVEPVGALALGGVLGAAGWGFLRMTRRRITAWGQAQQLHQGYRLQHLQQGLGSVKDIKLLGRETEFIERYSRHTAQAIHAGRRNMLLQQFPRLWLELVAVGGLVAMVVTMLSFGRNLDTVLPTLGLFAVAAFRLMPSVNRMLNAVQTLRFVLPAVENLNAEFGDIEPARVTPAEGVRPFISRMELVAISYSYPGAERKSLDKVSLSISRGESVGFIGASGAGKSTLVDVLLGLLSPQEGHVLIDGADLAENPRAWQSQIGYVPQSIYLTDDSLRSNVAFGVPEAQIDEAAVRRAIQAAQLDGFVASLADGLEAQVGERGVRLSGGQRQRIGIARALYHDPEVLVFDEATSALDTETEGGVMDAVRALKGKKTVIIVAHRLSTVQHCDRLFQLDRGRIVGVGTPEELIAA